MHIDRLENSEKEPVARPSSNKNVRLSKQRHAQLLSGALKSWTGASPY